MVILLAYPSSLYTVVLTVSYWSWIAIEIWLIVRERGDAKAASQDRGTRSLLIVSWIIAVVLGIFVAPYLLPQFTMRTKAVAIGVALVWTGIALRLWAIQTLGNFFTTHVIVRQEQRLVTAGPYQWLRNPAYTGTLTTFLGFGIAIGNWISLATLLALGSIPHIVRVTVEESANAAPAAARFADRARTR